MKAVNKWIVIIPQKEEIKAVRGVLKNDTSTIRFRKGLVISCNNESCKDGDTILYDVANSHTTKIDNESYLIIEAGNVAVIL